jgi:hypothetical protein
MDREVSQRGCAATKERIRAGSNQYLLVARRRERIFSQAVGSCSGSKLIDSPGFSLTFSD